MLTTVLFCQKGVKILLTVLSPNHFLNLIVITCNNKQTKFVVSMFYISLPLCLLICFEMVAYQPLFNI